MGIVVVGDEAAVFPDVELVPSAFAAFAEGEPESFELEFGEGVWEVAQHIFRAAFIDLVLMDVAAFEHIAEDADFRPEVVEAEPDDEIADGAVPRLVVEQPERGAFFPSGEDGAVGEFEEEIVVGQIGEASHFVGQLVGDLIELSDDETAFAIVEP